MSTPTVGRWRGLSPAEVSVWNIPSGSIPRASPWNGVDPARVVDIEVRRCPDVRSDRSARKKSAL